VTVMIGIDPHKGSHTAVAVGEGERSLAELRVRSGPKQLERLLQWAERFPERTWAVENATGLGYLLAQQLVAAGERVLDVQPKLAARVRLLAAESTNKNDPHDALSVAVAALRSSSPKQVGVEDHAAVMKLWARRHRNLSSARTQIACRLHAVLCDLVAGGVPDEIHAERAALLLAEVEPDSAVAAARVELASELVDDLRRIDRQLVESKKRLEQVVAAAGTTVIDLFGVGPVVAATVVGVTGDIARRDRFAAFNGTAPIEVAPIRQRRRAPPLPRLDLTTQDDVRWRRPLTPRPRPVRRRPPARTKPRSAVTPSVPQVPDAATPASAKHASGRPAPQPCARPSRRSAHERTPSPRHRAWRGGVS
jgi:transposase